MVMERELVPTDGRKNVGNRAYIKIGKDGSETLISYDTPIIRRKPNGELVRLFNDWTATTGRHIRYFCGLGKKEFMALPVTGPKADADFEPISGKEAKRRYSKKRKVK